MEGWAQRDHQVNDASQAAWTSCLGGLETEAHYNAHQHTFALEQSVLSVTSTEVSAAIRSRACLFVLQLGLPPARTENLFVKTYPLAAAACQDTTFTPIPMQTALDEFAHGVFCHQAGLPVPRYYQLLFNQEHAALVMEYKGRGMHSNGAVTGAVSYAMLHDLLALRYLLDREEKRLETKVHPLWKRLQGLVVLAMEGIHQFGSHGTAFYYSLPRNQRPPARPRTDTYFRRRIFRWLNALADGPTLAKANHLLDDRLLDVLLPPLVNPSVKVYGHRDEFFHNLGIVAPRVAGQSPELVVYDLEKSGFGSHPYAMVKLLLSPVLGFEYGDIVKLLERGHRQFRHMLAAEKRWITAQKRDQVCPPAFEEYLRDFLFCSLYEVVCLLGKMRWDRRNNPLYHQCAERQSLLLYHPDLAAVDFTPYPVPHFIPLERLSWENSRHYYQTLIPVLLEQASALSKNSAMLSQASRLYELLLEIGAC